MTTAAAPVNLMMPGNSRYQPEVLRPIFGHDHLFGPFALVEIAALEVLGDIGVIRAPDIALLTSEVRQQLIKIPTTAVEELERTVTKHDARAWVQIARDILPPPLRPWLHALLTTYDPMDTGRSIMFIRAHEIVVRPMTNNLIGCLAEMVKKYADVVQIGRTHGQHALPITVGFWLATILNRVLYNASQADTYAKSLLGKCSGAVGAFNAQVGLGIDERCGGLTFETRVLHKLGLKVAPISTQILPPEPLADYLFALSKMSATLAQFVNDCRHLMRSEIAEIGEPFGKGQVGSSTMAHKRNPIVLENTVGMWTRTIAEFLKVLLTLISEHQRDLTGSAVVRDFPTIVINLVQQLQSLLRESPDGVPFISRITVDEEACRRNLLLSGDSILAEPIYIALQIAGYPGDAHKLVSDKAMPHKQANRCTLLHATHMVLLEELPDDGDHIWARIPPQVLSLLAKPESYTGNASGKALQIARAAEDYLLRQNP